MPFITQERRKIIDKDGLEALNQESNALTNTPPLRVQPGDRCYVFYKQMVDRWKAKPRWTTAHEIFRDMLDDGLLEKDKEDFIASRLAWQVFFQLYVIPYELKKREENGDI